MSKEILKRFKKKTIYVYQYSGYNGGFARKQTLMWKCILVGVNGDKMFGGSWMSEGSGYADKLYADRDAERWSTFLGWPVVQLGRCEQFDSEKKY